MSSNEYKTAKEAFVTGHTGSSIAELLLLVLLWPVSLLLRGAAAVVLSHCCDGAAATVAPWRDFALDILALCGPALCVLTVSSSHVVEVVAVVAGIATVILVVAAVRGRALARKPAGDADEGRRMPALTMFRGFLMMYTVICILAVDFPVFPRRFAKTEEFGVSIMDMGVGAVVFSGGLVATHDKGASVAKTAVRALPLCVLAAGKTVGNILTGYQNHASEYGAHWNFFATLACLTIAHSVASQVITRMCVRAHVYVGLLAAGYALVLLQHAVLHAHALSPSSVYVTLAQYILHAPRDGDTFFSANREGLCGLPGFIATFVIGWGLGSLLRSVQQSSWRRRAVLLLFVTCNWLAFTAALHTGQLVSRRLVNAPYILFTVACCSTALLLLEAALIMLRRVSRDADRVRLLDAINSTNLATFMIANLCTGVVNFSMKTLYIADGPAFAILSLYLLVVMSFAVAMNSGNFNLKLKQ